MLRLLHGDRGGDEVKDSVDELIDDNRDMDIIDSFCERGGSEDVNLGEGRCCRNCLVSKDRGRLKVSASICMP